MQWRAGVRLTRCNVEGARVRRVPGATGPVNSLRCVHVSTFSYTDVRRGRGGGGGCPLGQPVCPSSCVICMIKQWTQQSRTAPSQGDQTVPALRGVRYVDTWTPGTLLPAGLSLVTPTCKTGVIHTEPAPPMASRAAW